MSGAALSVRALLGAAALSLTMHTAASAQAAAKPRHPVVCGNGVRVYTERAQLPAKRDSLTIPPSPGGPVRVSSPEEAEAAQLAIRERAGSIGATGILISDETTDDGGGQRVARRVSAYFVPSDSARAQQACSK